jgi:hypothetical protein
MQSSKAEESIYKRPIQKKISTSIKINSPKSEYSMKQNLIDPFKSSPPNDFIIKLQNRIQMYSNIFYVDNMVDSLDNE